LVFDHERSPVPWLSSQLGDHSSDLGIHIRKLVHQGSQFREVVPEPAQVCIDEFRFRVTSEYIVLLGYDGLPLYRVVVVPTARTKFKLQPSFVVRIHGLPERAWIRRMNQYRNAQLAALVPDRPDPRIIDPDPLALAVAHRHAQILVDLQTTRTHLHVLLQLAEGSLLPLRIVDP